MPNSSLLTTVPMLNATVQDTDTISGQNINWEDAEATIINITDYFSNHYPYYTTQFERYFNIDFEVSYEGFDDVFKVLTPHQNTLRDDNIERIEFRGDAPEWQIMSIKLKDPMMFESISSFRNFMEDNGYDFYGITRTHSLTSAYTKNFPDDDIASKIFIVFDIIDSSVAVSEFTFRFRHE